MPPPAPEPDPAHAATREALAAYFCRMSDAFGLPRSLGHLFATLYISPEPLAFEDVVRESGVSRASASTGLRWLVRLHAIESIVRSDDRRTFYRAETSARRIVAGIITGTILESIHDGDRLLDNARAAAPAGDPHLNDRLTALRRWHNRVRTLLPLVSRFAPP